MFTGCKWLLHCFLLKPTMLERILYRHVDYEWLSDRNMSKSGIS